MVWSPLQYTNRIFNSLKKMGYEKQVSTRILYNVIMLETKLINEKTIMKAIKALARLGYIEEIKPHVWIVRYWDFQENEAKLAGLMSENAMKKNNP